MERLRAKSGPKLSHNCRFQWSILSRQNGPSSSYGRLLQWQRTESTQQRRSTSGHRYEPDSAPLNGRLWIARSRNGHRAAASSTATQNWLSTAASSDGQRAATNELNGFIMHPPIGVCAETDKRADRQVEQRRLEVPLSPLSIVGQSVALSGRKSIVERRATCCWRAALACGTLNTCWSHLISSPSGAWCRAAAHLTQLFN